MLDPKDRAASGLAAEAQATARNPREPASLLEESWRDFVWAEVWTRPGLPMRPRLIVAMASAATCGLEESQLDDFVRGALVGGHLSLAELREAALHLAVYAGWGNGGTLDRSVTRMAGELALPPAHVPAICPEPWDAQARNDRGHAAFAKVMTFPPGPPSSPYLQGINNFVFGEMWWRPGLDEASRRWITLVGVCESAAEIPIRSHIHAAMASGNCTGEQMLEFVLQYGTHAGWPKASRINGVVQEMIGKVAKGLPWNG
ncbi:MULTISPECIES: carboxymuconolactone decarboxylase family protein [unclassified Novosphingobium]|uniref:carboxymuconolactone decarboxylase family protein n=1 Tax=unclassified Novosphingobium TaxID=2644732 RepID=UPI001F20800B|nr:MULTISPECIES: carboxymuconolactone decarboxylase family protein [unclassified Novosphingobium]